MITLDDVLQRIRAAYTARVNDVKKSVEGVKNALGRYEQAAEQDSLNDFLIANGLMTPPTTRQADDAALDLLHQVENLPELRIGTDVVEIPDEPDDEAPVEQAAAPPQVTEVGYQLLKRDGRPILLFGGFVNHEKLRSLTEATGLGFEWISNERNGSGDVECSNACRQLRNRRFVAVIIMNELISHTQGEMLVRAAKASNTRHAIGKKAGKGTVLAALALFERQLFEAGFVR